MSKKRDISQFLNPEITAEELEDFGKYLYHPSSRESGKNLNMLREEAKKLMQEDEDGLVMRSCWECNGAHEHLKKVDDCVILCPWCGNYFFKGIKITEED